MQVLCDFSIFDGDTGMWVESVPTPYFLCCHSCVALPVASQPALPPSTSPLGKPLCCYHAHGSACVSCHCKFCSCCLGCRTDMV